MQIICKLWGEVTALGNLQLTLKMKKSVSIIL